MSNKLVVRVGIILVLLLAFAAEFALHPSTARAASAVPAVAPGFCANSSTSTCSISHYVNYTSYGTEDSMVKNWGMKDASKIDPLGDNLSCEKHYYYLDVIAVLDFGSLEESGGKYGEINWSSNYFFPFSDIYVFAEDYATAYYNNAGVCSHLTVAIGTSNENECSFESWSDSCIYDAGEGLAGAVNDAQSYLNNQGGDVPVQLAMAGGDDIEYDGTWNWDTYNLTINAIEGFYDYNTSDGYNLFDYGDIYEPLCGSYKSGSTCGGGGTTSGWQYSCGNSSCGNPIWDYGEMYNVAWGWGNDVTLLECYSSSCSDGAYWGDVYNNTKSGCADCFSTSIPMSFWGVMTESGWNDPANDYHAFMSQAGGATPPFTYDTCMPTSPTSGTSPCY